MSHWSMAVQPLSCTIPRTARPVHMPPRELKRIDPALAILLCFLLEPIARGHYFSLLLPILATSAATGEKFTQRLDLTALLVAGTHAREPAGPGPPHPSALVVFAQRLPG